MRHWASTLVGKPWSPGATGPDAFYCWGLVQWVYLRQLDIEFPQVEIERDGDNLRAISAITRGANMCRVDGPPQEFDVLLMSGPYYKRHVGVMIAANGKLGVLHADGTLDSNGRPRGSVMFHTLAEATTGGYGQYEFWRRQK